MLKQLIFVFIGGGIGSMLRYGLGHGLNASFPYGTLVANLLGCLFIGVLLSLLDKQIINQVYYSLLVVGFCGGFTTFSSFSAESLKLFQNGQIGMYLLYAGSSIILGFIFVWFGFKLVKCF